jgi:V/A-type H+-transporting ATPase subunit D
MAGSVHVPPGRAGRLWLQHRISVATRGADLLDHKLRVLHAERQRLVFQAKRTRVAWEDACREADAWLVRGTLLGGERAVRLSAGHAPADVEIVWEQSMGVRFPTEARCVLPATDPEAPSAAGAALVLARQSHGRALVAGVEHAVVEAAIRVVEANATATRRRLRAIERRWLPRLQEELARRQAQLEEDEHADGLRLRWAAGRGGPPSPGRAVPRRRTPAEEQP